MTLGPRQQGRPLRQRLGFDQDKPGRRWKILEKLLEAGEGGPQLTQRADDDETARRQEWGGVAGGHDFG